MDLDQILAAVDDLSPEEHLRLQTYLAEHGASRPQRTAVEWMAELEDIACEFRGDSSEEEMQAIFEAMSPSDKVV